MLLTYFAFFLLIAQSLAQNTPWIGKPRDEAWLKGHEIEKTIYNIIITNSKKI
jgi:hypothetical protein